MINESQAHKFCCEDITKIEGYAEAIADRTKTWDIHHRLEVNAFNAARNDGGIVSRQQLIDDGMYYHRPASELVFVTRSQHKKIHKALCAKGGKIGGKIGGKNSSHADKVRVGKIGGKKMRGKKWWNNGSIGTRAFECPGNGWVKGRLKIK